MSGFEIAGVVLGSLPLIISAMEHYAGIKDTFGRVRRYQVELGRIKQDLDAESLIFRDILEHVLYGLVAPDQYEELLNNPSSGLWQDLALNEALKQRLDHSYTVFTNSVNSMNTIIQEFMKLLDLDDQGRTRWASSTGLKLFLKSIRFSTQKAFFDTQTKLLQHHNRHLEKLTNRSIELEPSRRRRRSSSRLQKMGQYATSVFHALEASFGCNCKGPDTHTALLGIHPRSADQNTNLNAEINFHIVISGETSDTQTMKDETTHWQEMILEAVELSPGNKNVRCQVLPLHSSQKGNHSTASGPKKARFISSSSASVPSAVPLPGATSSTRTTTITTSQSTIPIIQSTVSDIPIPNLCEMICRSPSKAKATAPRHVTDGRQKFLLHQTAHSSSLEKAPWSTISLHQILEGPGGSVPPLTPWDRLTLAAMVSSAVANLYHSPWLKPRWNDRSLLFLKREDRRLYNEAFVTKQMLDSGKAAVRHTEIPIFDDTLLTLAFMMVELCLGPLEKLQTQEDLRAGTFANLVTAWRLVANGNIQDELGPQYQSAVGRCLDLAKVTKTWDEKVQGEFYEGVVSVLEDQAGRRPSGP